MITFASRLLRNNLGNRDEIFSKMWTIVISSLSRYVSLMVDECYRNKIAASQMLAPLEALPQPIYKFPGLESNILYPFCPPDSKIEKGRARKNVKSFICCWVAEGAPCPG